MPDRLFRFYQRRRIVNVNVNVIAAGIVSTSMVMGLVWVLKHPLAVSWPTWGFTAFSLAADLLIDGVLFVGLHWVANHWRPVPGRTEREKQELSAKPPPFARDSIVLSAQRALLSPVFLVIAGVGTELLQRGGVAAYWAVGIAYMAGILVTRVLHTWWGLRSGTYRDHAARESATAPPQDGGMDAVGGASAVPRAEAAEPIGTRTGGGA